MAGPGEAAPGTAVWIPSIAMHVQRQPKVAFVHEALPFRGGAERTLEAALEVFPSAPVFTLLYNPEAFTRTALAGREIHTSFIDRLPRARQAHRSYLPLYPLAVETFDLRGYDVILSFSYATAHGVLPREDQLHISYAFTPLRYAWRERAGEGRAGWKGWAIHLALHYYRLWNRAAIDRVDRFAAVSRCAARRIWRAYRRRARVIYPPVEVQRFRPVLPRQPYYLVVSRLEPHKRISLVVEAFARLKLPLLVVGEGSERARLARLAPSNVRLLGWQRDAALEQLLGQAKALVHAAEEDFGIALVEAQASGCPVIAYGKGGAAETVLPGRTGLLYPEQSAECLACAVETFERREEAFDPAELIANAGRFSKERFQRRLRRLVLHRWEQFDGADR